MIINAYLELDLQQGTPYPRAITVGSASKLEGLSNCSIDYIFTDPPFGSNIFYADCNLIWESWLGEFTNQAHEAVVHIKHKDKNTLPDYQQLMGAAFAEMFRVFKITDYLKFIAMRLPSAMLIFVTDYLILGLFDVEVGFLPFISVYPAVILIAVLPVTVSGLGSGQLAARTLLLDLVVGPSRDAIHSAATIDAFSSAVIFTSLFIKIGIGLFCLFAFRRIVTSFDPHQPPNPLL